MAIQYNYTDPSGVNHSEAYLRISHYQVFKRQDRAFFWYDVFHNKAAADSGKQPLNGSNYLSVEAKNIPVVLDKDGNTVEIAHPDYDDYFKDNKLKVSGSTPEKNFYIWFKERYPTKIPNFVDVI